MLQLLRQHSGEKKKVNLKKHFTKYVATTTRPKHYYTCRWLTDNRGFETTSLHKELNLTVLGTFFQGIELLKDLDQVLSGGGGIPIFWLTQIQIF